MDRRITVKAAVTSSTAAMAGTGSAEYNLNVFPFLRTSSGYST